MFDECKIGIQTYLITDKAEPCDFCEKPTRFVEMDFEGRFCPEWCGPLFLLEYATHINSLYGEHPPPIQILI